MGSYDKNLSTQSCSEVTTGAEKIQKECGDSRVYKTDLRDKIGMSLATFEHALFRLSTKHVSEVSHAMQKFSTRQAGFTLVEVMVAAGILTVAAALVLPNFLQWHAQTQLRQATSDIATQLTLARMAGMNRNRGVDVTVQNVGGAVQISAASSGVPIFSDKTLPPRASSVVGSPVTVSFSSLGLRTSGGTGVQTIGVCDTYKRQYSVAIIPSGKVNFSLNSSGTPCP